VLDECLSLEDYLASSSSGLIIGYNIATGLQLGIGQLYHLFLTPLMTVAFLLIHTFPQGLGLFCRCLSRTSTVLKKVQK
jgi:hypothetical protein